MVIVPRKYLEDLEKYRLENESVKNDMLSGDRTTIILKAKRGYSEAGVIYLVDENGKSIKKFILD
jgi:hypothetical protein